MIFRAILFVSCAFANGLGAQETMRFATFNVGLDRDGPGLLLKDIRDGDADIIAVAQIIALISPDILLLTNFDYDYNNVALQAFRDLIKAETGLDYGNYLALGGNAGVPSGLDLNGNDRLGDWRDNWGFGRFEGNGGMAILSKFPIDPSKSRQFNEFLWQDISGAVEPSNLDGSPFLPNGNWSKMRLASHSIGDLEVILPNQQRIRILASHPTPPVFDGIEDFNGLRNDAEIRFWVEYLNQKPMRDDLGNLVVFSGGPFVLLGDLNADRFDGESIGIALDALLSHPLISDPTPQSKGGAAAARLQAGTNDTQTGDPGLDTADWDDKFVGNLRVDYVLPAAELRVLDSGVFWPGPDHPDYALLEIAKSAHRLVWVDVALR